MMNMVFAKVHLAAKVQMSGGVVTGVGGVRRGLRHKPTRVQTTGDGKRST